MESLHLQKNLLLYLLNSCSVGGIYAIGEHKYVVSSIQGVFKVCKKNVFTLLQD